MDNIANASGKIGRTIWARIDDGFELVESLQRLALEHHISHGTVQVIGAIKYIELITPNLENPKHEGREQKVEEPCEIMAIGNIVPSATGEPVMHLHCTLARQNTTALSGHVIKALALYFLEISITEALDMNAVRIYDPVTTFNVLRVGENKL